MFAMADGLTTDGIDKSFAKSTVELISNQDQKQKLCTFLQPGSFSLAPSWTNSAYIQNAQVYLNLSPYRYPIQLIHKTKMNSVFDAIKK